MELVTRTFSDVDDAMIWVGHMEGTPDRELADQLNMSITTLRERRAELTVRPATRRPIKCTTWTMAEVKFALRKARIGWTQRQIGKALNRSTDAVQHQMRRIRRNSC